MKTSLLSILFGLAFISTAIGQIKIGDNPQNIDPTSVLELESNSRVLVITRISTLEMEAIVPNQGAMVYNTDTQCVHYYDGTQWVNLCSALGLTFTTDGIVDRFGNSTIVITQTGSNYNFEVAPKSISSEQIAPSGLHGNDIQNNTIGIEDLQIDSVGNEELAENAVESEEIKDQSIFPVDISPGNANTVLMTSADGLDVEWNTLDTNSITGQDLTADDPSITITNGIGATLMDTGIEVTDGGISTPKLAADAVDNSKLADDAVRTENLLDLSVTDAKLDKGNIPLSGFGTAAADVALGNNKLINLANPTLDQDAATKIYVDNTVGGINTLNNGSIYVGDATNTAVEVIIGGDATMDNAGILTIEDDAVTTAKILNANVTNTKLDKGNIPLSGFGAAVADVELGNNKLINLANPTLDQDAATKIYVDNTVGGINTLNDGSIYVGDATNTAAEVSINGDATIDNTGLLTIEDDAVNTDKILDGTIVDADVNTNAAITGTKIIPNFGPQNIITTGTLTTTGMASIGANTITNVDGTNGQVLTTDGAGTASWANPASPFHAVGKINQAVAINSSGIIAPINNLGAGNYQVTFTTAAGSVDYVIQLTLFNAGAGSSIEVTTQTATGFTVQINDSLGVPLDANWYFTVTDF